MNKQHDNQVITISEDNNLRKPQYVNKAFEQRYGSENVNKSPTKHETNYENYVAGRDQSYGVMWPDGG